MLPCCFQIEKKDKDKVKVSYIFVSFPGEEIIFILLFKSSGLRIEKKDPITDTETYFTSTFLKGKGKYNFDPNTYFQLHIFLLVYLCSPPKFELLTFLNKNQSYSTIIPRDSCLTNRCLNLLLVLIG